MARGESPDKGALGAAALPYAVEHITAAVSAKVEASVGRAVGRAAEQLKQDEGRIFDKAQQEAEARVLELKEPGGGDLEARRRSHAERATGG